MKLEDLEKIIPWTDMNFNNCLAGVSPHPLGDDVVGVGVSPIDRSFVCAMSDGTEVPMLLQ